MFHFSDASSPKTSSQDWSNKPLYQLECFRKGPNNSKNNRRSTALESANNPQNMHLLLLNTDEYFHI